MTGALLCAGPEVHRRAALMWHRCECGSYRADLPIWRELAVGPPGRVVELGAGLGRVALDLAERGCDVVAVERDAILARALADRARERSLSLRVETADAREASVGAPVGTVLATMQMLQLLPDAASVESLVAEWVQVLAPGGAFAAAIVEGVPEEMLGDAPPVPDVVEDDGWLAASTPVAVEVVDGFLVVRRRRELVSPTGSRFVEEDETRLLVLDAASVAELLESAGLSVSQRISISPTPDHVGSTVLVAGHAGGAGSR